MGILKQIKEKFHSRETISSVKRELSSNLKDSLKDLKEELENNDCGCESDDVVVDSGDVGSDRVSLKSIYSFHEGAKEMKDLLGGKGANLAEMKRLGLPVPEGFTITTDACNFFLETGNYPKGFHDELAEHLAEVESKMGKKFGDIENPLLFSVRSGAKISMPGMMDTVLNLGLNDAVVQGLINQTGNARCAYDSYRRFIQMFSDIVLGVDHAKFEHALEGMREVRGVTSDIELTVEDFKELISQYKAIVFEATREQFPTEPIKQLSKAIEAVFNSWTNERAITYRKLNDIPDDIGTAVNVQSMVFGNKGETSGTGVAFTRNPSTGEKKFYGEFLTNAQGEDVVAGIRTPQKIEKLQEIMPNVYSQLIEIKDKLEQHYTDMQDIEFTIEEGELYVLQTRTGKRTAHAALRVAVDMVEEGLITKEEAILRQDPNMLNTLLHPSIDKSHSYEAIAKGLPASPGAACGIVVFESDDAVNKVENEDTKVILVRRETSPEDIQGMHAAEGILTSTGGMTSHAAVVCRGMGKPCVAGCSKIRVMESDKKFVIGDIIVKEGDIITLDGSTGEVILGELKMKKTELSGHFRTIMDWAKDMKTMSVRTNADTGPDCKIARDFDAEGVGLCRTEHMFFEEDRIMKVREMILSKTDTQREAALKELLPMQKADFKDIFKAMDGLPVTVRLLDPPLHEFLPSTEEKLTEVASNMTIPKNELRSMINQLHEVNPMLGHRGCRLGITFPAIYQMQVLAILGAAIECHEEGIEVHPEIEVPLVGCHSELKAVKAGIEAVTKDLRPMIKFDYKVGTMIEVPRACLTADEIALEADFLSFGTNDLTQTTFGISRDDAGKFLNHYLDKKIFPADPAATIDQKGVGRLMQMTVELGRKANPNIEIGICGEHGGEPKSVEFCQKIGLDYVSCSPYRVPVAILAAAQSAIKSRNLS
ncbi:pyruvate, phosphate dikinase [Candidatus Peregrinibacteria bacterium]|jgi:pyruvate, orthophosphate dikinase|nr:pyruvate, phosphate dikinase [Candidatus Peregrinibacteria bacterium]